MSESTSAPESGVPVGMDGSVESRVSQGGGAIDDTSRVVRLASPNDLREHESATLVPPMREREYEDFRNDVRARGITTPLEVHGNIVLDGRHRLRAAREVGLLQVPVIEVQLKGASEIDHILRAAVIRRHLSDDQRAVVAAMYLQQNPRPRGGDRRSEAIPAEINQAHVGQIDPTPGRSIAAVAMNVSTNRVKKATFLLSSAPGLAANVHRGEMKLAVALRSIERAEQLKRIETTKLPDGLYRTIVADPPWSYDDDRCEGAAEHFYPTMSLEQICALPVKERAAREAHLFLWVPNPHLELGFQVARAWGFQYKTTLTWIKRKLGLGRYFRGCTEHVLFCTRGNLPLREQDIRNWFEAANKRHSQKPEEFYEIVERASYALYLELFARRRRKGWICCGPEVDSPIHETGLEVKPHVVDDDAEGQR